MGSVLFIFGVFVIAESIFGFFEEDPLERECRIVLNEKLKKVDVDKLREEVRQAKIIQRANEYNYEDKELIDLKKKLQELISGDRLASHNVLAISEGLEELNKLIEDYMIQSEDAKVYLREIYRQAQTLTGKAA